MNTRRRRASCRGDCGPASVAVRHARNALGNDAPAGKVSTAMNKPSLLCVVTLALSLSPGCYWSMGRLPLASTSSSEPQANASRVSGQDCVFVFLVPFGAPKIDRAVADALGNSDDKGDALADMTVRLGHTGLGLIGKNCLRVEGSPVARAPHGSGA